MDKRIEYKEQIIELNNIKNIDQKKADIEKFNAGIGSTKLSVIKLVQGEQRITIKYEIYSSPINQDYMLAVEINFMNFLRDRLGEVVGTVYHKKRLLEVR